MRRVLTSPGFLIFVVPSVAFYQQWTKFTAGAASAPFPIDSEASAAQVIDPPLAQLSRLVAGDGAAGDRFSESVAISGDTLVVGARGDDIGTNGDRGSAYVFVRSGGVWSFRQKLIANDGAASDLFGYSVAISGDYIVIGAILKDINGNSNQGAAYVFVRSGGTWTQQARLLAGDGASNDGFGYSVSISGARVAVGAPGADVGGKQNQGSVYLFTRSGSAWTQEITLRANDGAADDLFGSSVALAGAALISGAPGADVATTPDQGAARCASTFARPAREDRNSKNVQPHKFRFGRKDNYETNSDFSPCRNAGALAGWRWRAKEKDRDRKARD